MLRTLLNRCKRLPSCLLMAVLLSPALSVQAHEYTLGELHIAHPWSREMPPGAPNAAAYFIVHNAGTEADRLMSVETPVAGKAELHEHVHRDGLMRMQQVQQVDVPAGGDARFAPMGYHVMLFQLKQPLRDGERFPLTLHFEKAGALLVEVAVQKDAPVESAPAGRGPTEPGSHGEHGSHGEAHDH